MEEQTPTPTPTPVPTPSLGNNQRRLVLGLFALLFLTVPLTIMVLQQNQDVRQRADTVTPTPAVDNIPASSSASTELLFKPLASASASFAIGDEVKYDIMIDPGKNLPTIVKLAIEYDETVLEASSSSVFETNITDFPTTVEGPAITPEGILVTVSIGSDPNLAIQTLKKVGTLTLKVKGNTSSNGSPIAFGKKTEVLSIGQEDAADQNVLAKAAPAIFKTQATTGDSPTPTATSIAATVVPTEAPTPTNVPTPTATSTPTPMPTKMPTPTPTDSKLAFTVYLNGLGRAGDRSNRNSKGNQHPVVTTRVLDVEIYNDKNVRVERILTPLVFNKESGNFKGVAITNLPNGVYTLRIKTDRHLARSSSRIITIKRGATLQVPDFYLTNGDVNGDNRIDIRDYNQISGCYSSLAPAKDCDDQRKKGSDLNDDGNVNEYDYNLYLREISAQEGE